MPHVLTKFGLITKAAVMAMATGCSGTPNLPNDDLGYDPAVRDLDATPMEVFDPLGLPVGAAGVPLRGVAVEGEWRTHLGNFERTGTRLAPAISEPVIRWSAEVGIQGYANTPLVGHDAIFVTSQGSVHNQSDSEDGFYAIDPDSGARLWFYPTNEDVNGASLTDEFVVGGTDDGTLYAIDRASGEARWEAEIGSSIHHGPTVVGNRLLVQLMEGYVEIDARNGQMLQRGAGAEDGYDVRGTLTTDGESVYRLSRACSVEAFEDGDLEWSRTTCSPHREDWRRASLYAPSVILGGALLTLTPVELDYEVATVTLGLYDRAGGGELWTISTEAELPDDRETHRYDRPYFASSSWVMNGVAFVPRLQHADVVGFDLSTGEARLQVPMPDCRCRQFASIVGVPSAGYFARHDGRLYSFHPATGDVEWVMSLAYNATASVQAADGPGWGGSHGYCSPDPWDGSALFSTPALGEDGTLYVGSGEGWLYAIEEANW